MMSGLARQVRAISRPMESCGTVGQSNSSAQKRGVEIEPCNLPKIHDPVILIVHLDHTILHREAKRFGLPGPSDGFQAVACSAAGTTTGRI